MKKLITIFTLLIIGMSSCQDIENCDTNDSLDFMIVRFFDWETRSSKKVGFTITAENSPYNYVLSTDSTFVNLPLDPLNTQTTFFFDTETSHFEVEMSYERKEITIFDPKCDPFYTYIGLDTIRNTFDSLAIIGTVTNRQLSTNVEIYF